MSVLDTLDSSTEERTETDPVVQSKEEPRQRGRYTRPEIRGDNDIKKDTEYLITLYLDCFIMNL